VVQWLEAFLIMEAAGAFLLAGLNALLVARLASRARTHSRRVGAWALAGLCGALQLEALLFLALAWPARPEGALAVVAMLLMRTAMLLSSAFLSLLLLRGAAWQQRQAGCDRARVGDRKA
jgi:hypothetical protein